MLPVTTQTAAPDPAALLRSRSYLVLLVFGAAIGAPVAAVAYFFLKAVAVSQHFVFTSFPRDVGFGGEPAWWPIWPLVLSGVLVAFAIRLLPGTGGHPPAGGFKA